MKSFNKLSAAVIAVIIAVFAVANILLINADKDDGSRPYRVEAQRIAKEIEENGFSEIHSEKYDYISNIELLSSENSEKFYNADSDYLIKIINGQVYRFDYSYKTDHSANAVVMNLCLAIAAAAVMILMIVIKIKIIKPFEQIKEIPFELAKGNLSAPLKENKSKYFGRFVWGLDLLRERLEQQKAAELEIQRKNKTLVMSLSHDIKTPLSVIELYSKALEKGLYSSEEKKKEIALSINGKCDEIKNYVNDIIRASNEDFLNLEVNNGEFYLSDMIHQINSFYTDKLELLKIDFKTGKFADCILFGDTDRAVEVLQNVMENAIKYGDGQRIEISFAQEEGCMLVSVSNSGCTLKADELTHIFDSFHRGSNAGSNSGSGLGLYICRQLMNKMNGDIFAEIKDGSMIVTAVFAMM